MNKYQVNNFSIVNSNMQINPIPSSFRQTSQVDVRRVNSWLLKLDQVSTSEAAEVMAINALAPFVLNGRLRGLMERTRPPTNDTANDAPKPAETDTAAAAAEFNSSSTLQWPKFIVNVSAMVGKMIRRSDTMHVVELKYHEI